MKKKKSRVNIEHMFKNRTFWSFLCIFGWHMFPCIISWMCCLGNAEFQETVWISSRLVSYFLYCRSLVNAKRGKPTISSRTKDLFSTLQNSDIWTTVCKITKEILHVFCSQILHMKNLSHSHKNCSRRDIRNVYEKSTSSPLPEQKNFATLIRYARIRCVEYA